MGLAGWPRRGSPFRAPDPGGVWLAAASAVVPAARSNVLCRLNVSWVRHGALAVGAVRIKKPCHNPPRGFSHPGRGARNKAGLSWAPCAWGAGVGREMGHGCGVQNRSAVVRLPDFVPLSGASFHARLLGVSAVEVCHRPNLLGPPPMALSCSSINSSNATNNTGGNVESRPWCPAPCPVRPSS